MTTATMDSHFSASSSRVADTLLSPLKWCGTEWDHLGETVDRNHWTKISTIAQKIIFGALLAIATVMAFIPGMVGSLIKTFSHPQEEWMIIPDEQLKNRCREIGINDPTTSEADLSEIIRRRLPYGFATTISVNRIDNPSLSKLISIQPGTTRNQFLGHLADSLTRSEVNLRDRLPDVILGLQRNPTANSDILSLQEQIGQYHNIRLHIAEDLSQMHLHLH
jgi:hypothetical protein